MTRARRFLGTTLLIAAMAALTACPASATFHEMSIREVYPAGDSSYVELQMWSSGQNFVANHHLVLYDASGAVSDNFKFTASVPNGANQSTIVVADTDYPIVFDEMPAADATDPSLDLSPAGGAVCWTEGEPPDCVAWGSFAGSLVSPTGPAVAPGGVPAGTALRRSIAAGCPTLLEPTDDRDNSAVDFALVPPAPRPNSVAPSEHPCASGGAGNGPSGTGQGRGAPQTSLKHTPSHRTRDRTPTFRFASDEPRSTFQCKLDSRPYRRCKSPFTTARLSLGPHTFKVRARDDSGKLDPTPAAFAFRVTAQR